MSASNPSQDRYFPSKRDWWIVGLIWMGVLISVIGGILPLVLAGASRSELVLVLGLLLGMDSLMLWVLYGTGYRVAQDRLLIRCGPFAFHVPLKSINSITPTRSPWSSPACSLDRLKIVYGSSKQSLMVSPADKPGFLSAIVKQCPTLVVLHDRVRKRTNVPPSGVNRTIQSQVIA
jgi:hypothetical protein